MWPAAALEARGGTGSHHFAEEGDTAGRLVSGEVDGLLAQAVQAASLIIRPTAAVPGLRIWNDVSSTAIEGGVMVELGDLYAGEKRKVIVSTVVPAMAELGLAKVADLQLRYVELPGLHEHTIETPIYVNVVPGDQAAGRIADPVVRTEMHYQQAQDAKRRAADALRCADPAEAAGLYAEAGERLDVAACAAPPALAAEMAEETALLRDLAQRAVRDDASRVAKFSDADRAFKARKRGR